MWRIIRVRLLVAASLLAIAAPPAHAVVSTTCSADALYDDASLPR